MVLFYVVVFCLFILQLMFLKKTAEVFVTKGLNVSCSKVRKVAVVSETSLRVSL